jgi:hypothetical protein
MRMSCNIAKHVREAIVGLHFLHGGFRGLNANLPPALMQSSDERVWGVETSAAVNVPGNAAVWGTDARIH